MEPGLQICVSSKTSSSGLSVTHESGYCGTPLQLVIVLSDEAQLSVKPHNGVRFVFHPKGLRPFVENWEAVAARIIQRVHREVAVNPSDETMKCFLEELLSYPGIPGRWRVRNVDDSPIAAVSDYCPDIGTTREQSIYLCSTSVASCSVHIGQP